MRDLFMLGAMLLWVPLALGDVFVAYLLWEWISLVSPQYFLFGFMGSFRYGLLFAGITLLLVLLGKADTSVKLQAGRTHKLLIVFLIHASLVTVFAHTPNPLNSDVYFNLAKTLIYVLLMPLLVNDRTRLHAMLVMLALGVGFHGVQEGMKFIVNAGNYLVMGIPGTMMGDNNHLALAINMVIPILYYLYQYSEKKWVKFGFLIAMLVIVAAVVGSRSRGGFVTLSMVGFFLVMGSQKKFLSLVLVLLAGAVVVLLGSESWLERINTIKTAEEDVSFMGRIASWNLNTLIAMSNPLFGGGFHLGNQAWPWQSFDCTRGPFTIYSHLCSETGRAAHSIYFEVMGDMGFVGFFIFMAILFNAVWTRFEIVALCQQSNQKLAWARNMADMLTISVLAYMVGGLAVSMGYFDLIYIVAMMLEIVKQVVQRQTGNDTPTTQPGRHASISNQS